MKTTEMSIIYWKSGSKTSAFSSYLSDEGSDKKISFVKFCELFPAIVKLHDENEAATLIPQNVD